MEHSLDWSGSYCTRCFALWADIQDNKISDKCEAQVYQYRHIASGFCSLHGWFQHQEGYSGCDRCEAQKARSVSDDGKYEPLRIVGPNKVDDGSWVEVKMNYEAGGAQMIPYKPPLATERALLKMIQAAARATGQAVADNMMTQGNASAGGLRALFDNPDADYLAIDRISQLEAEATTYQRHVTQLANQVEERDHMLAEMAVQLREAMARMQWLEDAQVRLIRSAAGAGRKVDLGPEAMPERALGHCWAVGRFPR